MGCCILDPPEGNGDLHTVVIFASLFFTMVVVIRFFICVIFSMGVVVTLARRIFRVACEFHSWCALFINSGWVLPCI